jgi:hypothetical protein
MEAVKLVRQVQWHHHLDLVHVMFVQLVKKRMTTVSHVTYVNLEHFQKKVNRVSHVNQVLQALTLVLPGANFARLEMVILLILPYAVHVLLVLVLELEKYVPLVQEAKYLLVVVLVWIVQQVMVILIA